MERIRKPDNKIARVNGIRLHYLEWGIPGAVPLILLHGICASARYWDSLAGSLCGEYHILAVDQRGHGDSDWAESYGPRDYILDLEAFVDRLKLSEFVLIGHSMGGINAIIYAARHPDQVRALVIVDIGPEIDDTGAERMKKDFADAPESFGSEEEAVSYMKTVEPRQRDDFIRHQAKYALKWEDKGRLTFKYDKKLLSTDLRSPEWLWTYVSEIICPALLIHGTESDMLTVKVAQVVAGHMSFGSLAEVDGAGHGIPGDNPEAFEARVRDFLKSNNI